MSCSGCARDDLFRLCFDCQVSQVSQCWGGFSDILKFSGMWSGPELILQIWTLETRWVYNHRLTIINHRLTIINHRLTIINHRVLCLWVNWRWWSSCWESCSFKNLQPPHATRQKKCRHGSRFSSKVDLLCLSNGVHCFSLFLYICFMFFSVFRIRAGGQSLTDLGITRSADYVLAVPWWNRCIMPRVWVSVAKRFALVAFFFWSLHSRISV